MGSLGVAEMLILLMIGVVPFGIAVLCYVWMKNSRASQRRMEQHQAEMIRLLEEQNQLLRRERQQTTVH